MSPIINILFKSAFYDDVNIEIKDSISLSDWEMTSDLIQHLIEKHNVPEYAIKSFEKYVYEYIEDIENENVERILEDVKSELKQQNRFESLNRILYQYKSTWCEYQTPKPQSDQEIFATAYLRLVESGSDAMESLAKLELQFTQALSEKVAQRDMVLTSLDEEHSHALADLELSDHQSKPSALNQLERSYHQNRQQTEINWNSDISALREHQRRDFRDYVMEASNSLLLSDKENQGLPLSNMTDATPTTPNNSKSATKSPIKQDNSTSINKSKKKRSISNIVNKMTHSNQSNAGTPSSNSSSTNNIGLFNKLSDFNRLLGIGQSSDDSSPPVSNISSNVSRQSNSRKTTATAATSHDCIKWQESFTIHIGRQMRSTHNMRIMCVDSFDMLNVPDLFQTASSSKASSPSDSYFRGQLSPDTIANRLTTSLSLYSRNLTGLVLLVDNRLSTFSGSKKKFSHLCERSTDFHFQQLESQLEEIKKTLESFSHKKGGHVRPQKEQLEAGDVYITRHSNLNVATVIFHLVLDESMIQNNMRFPSPIHTGLRNILRTCFLHDIFCLNLPLLMSHEMRDYMDNAWCMRRVEAVLKAVKGSLMELCTWRGRESRTIQFLVPPSILHTNKLQSSTPSQSKDTNHTQSLKEGNCDNMRDCGSAADGINSNRGEQLLNSFSSLVTEYFQPSKAVK